MASFPSHKGQFHRRTNHTKEREKTADDQKKIDHKCCVVFPLNCGHCCFSGQPIEPFYSILEDSSPPEWHLFSSPIWSLDQGTIFLDRRVNFSYLVSPRNGPYTLSRYLYFKTHRFRTVIFARRVCARIPGH